MAEASQEARQAWGKVVAAVKDGPMNLALWEALESCVGLGIVGDTFYVGMDAAELHRASVIKAPQAMAQVESATQKALGQRYRVEIIEGQDPEAMEREAARVEARGKRERQTQQRLAERRAEGDTESWDSLSRHMHSSFAKFPDKGLPWRVVEYMREMLAEIVKVEKIRREKGDEERDIDRGLARVLSALSSQVDAPPMWVASEYLRVKQESE
jgi:hypothetical protein